MMSSCLQDAFDPTRPNLKRSRCIVREKKEWDHSPWIQPRQKKKRSTRSMTQPESQSHDDPELLASFQHLDPIPCIQQLAQLENTQQLTYLLGHLNLSDNQDQSLDIMEEISRQVDMMTHYPHILLLLRHILVPQLKKRTSLLPRPLTQQLLQIQNHRALLQGLVLEYITSSKDNSPFPTVHNTTLIKLIQQWSPSLRQTFIHDLLQTRPWKKEKEDTILILIDKALTQLPLFTSLPFLDELLHVIRLGVQSDPKAKGYMQLLLILTSKYGTLLVTTSMETLDKVEHIAQSSDMFLKRAVLGQLTSIRKKLIQ
ncbi:hypothetical protein BDA99DRAFT_601772 [Phascolomyces articulosus]|uniref:Fanconi Anaemia group E protein C-terminal domain-containing protein n=1 Tax=Phascolomyces articulosus TaxID=60185 RepID=A0AAD5PIL0_9FUNG|nr:hypothetical protein BDA99DRAFT_601772 [Phascolomyces articulosus]